MKSLNDQIKEVQARMLEYWDTKSLRHVMFPDYCAYEQEEKWLLAKLEDIRRRKAEIEQRVNEMRKNAGSPES